MEQARQGAIDAFFKRRHETVFNFVDEIDVSGEEHFPELIGKQAAYFFNHKSHFDYALLAYLFWKNNLPYPRFVAGKNLDSWFMRRFFNLCRIDLEMLGAFFVDRSKMSLRVNNAKDVVKYGRKVQEDFKWLLNRGESFLVFPEGGRNYSNNLFGQIKLGGINWVFETQEKNPELMIVPGTVNYDKVIEQDFFSRLEKAKNKGTFLGNMEYYFWDIFAFASRYFEKEKGTAYFNFGKPVMLKEFKTSRELSDFIQEELKELYLSLKI